MSNRPQWSIEIACILHPFSSSRKFLAHSGHLYIANPNAVMMQYIVLFSHRKVCVPSLVPSQNAEVAVWSPAPAEAISLALQLYDIPMYEGAAACV
jgi:hypothetical protein